MPCRADGNNQQERGLLGEQVCLRSLDSEDATRIHAWQNDSSLYECLEGSFAPVSRAIVAEWIAAKSRWSEDQVNLAICRRDSGEHIGNIYLRDIDGCSRHGELHIYLGAQENRGAGYGRDAVMTLLRYAFYSRGLNRVYLRVLASNKSALSCYQHCGFREEGRMRSHVFKLGRWVDVIVMGLLREEFEVANPIFPGENSIS